MTICRFFAQGRCRYGDRCRFEHVVNSYNKQSYDNNAGNFERHGSNHNRYDNGYRNYNDDYQNYTSDRYDEKFSRYSGQNSEQQYRNRQEYEQRNYEQNFGKKQHQYYAYENKNTHGQNRFRWLSDDYKNQTRESARQNAYEYENNSYTTSTPKGKPSFSFKVPESEVKKGGSHFLQIDEQDQMLTELVHEDAKSWEYGGQWPFTCYFPYHNKCAFPGFYDVSPEELRYAAYKSEESGFSKDYIQAIQNALNQVNQQRSELKVATPELLSTLRKIKDGEDIYSTSQKINPIASLEYNDDVVEIMELPDISFTSNTPAASFSFKSPTDVSNAASSFSFKTPTPISNAASSFSFKIPSETDSAVKTSASSFSFKLPSETKFVGPTASDGDLTIYTPFGNLTEEEREQFSASTFVLGKIPTKPPSLIFCK